MRKRERERKRIDITRFLPYLSDGYCPNFLSRCFWTTPRKFQCVEIKRFCQQSRMCYFMLCIRRVCYLKWNTEIFISLRNISNGEWLRKWFEKFVFSFSLFPFFSLLFFVSKIFERLNLKLFLLSQTKKKGYANIFMRK